MMTNKEALKAMRTFNHLLEGGDIGPDVTCGDVVKATRVAIEALESKSEAEEYRIPKKVKPTIRIGHDLVCNAVQCPTCGQWVTVHKGSYCTSCGQALDWSEVKE